MLTPFHYQNDKAIPWRYTCNVTTPGPLIVPFSLGSTSQQTVNDITGVGGMTQSGLCQEEKSMEKTNTVTVKTHKQKVNTVVLPPVETNAPITKAEACEFLKFIKHNEYNLVEQLNKTPSRISLLSLLTSFEPH